MKPFYADIVCTIIGHKYAKADEARRWRNCTRCGRVFYPKPQEPGNV